MEPASTPTSPADPNGQGTHPVDQAPTSPTAPATPDGNQNAGQPGDVASLPDWAQAMIGDLRKEAAGYRVKARDAEQQHAQTLEAIARALGINQDSDGNGGNGQTPTAEDVARELETARADARAARVELEVYRAAQRAGADPDALLDSRSFRAAVDRLEDGDDYADRLAKLIREQVDRNPRMRAGQVPAASGGEMTGGTGVSKPRPKTLGEAVARYYRSGA